MLAVVGCGSSGPPAIDIDPVAASQAAMRTFDTDGDGQLMASELLAAAGLRACLPMIDADGDGAVSRAEIEKRLAAYVAAAPHIEPFVCFVWHRGQPLTGAEVRLVPEPFLADDLPAATGTVGDDGFCVVAIDAEKMPIVHAGMYRVEIRSPHVNLPDKFNDRTELGVEVAAKSITLRRGGTDQFDLGS